MIGDFLYTHTRKFQKIFSFEYYIIIDPLSRFFLFVSLSESKNIWV